MGDLDLGPARRLAAVLAPDRLHLIGVGLTRRRRGGVAVSRRRGRGVSHQSGQLPLACGAQDLIAGDGLGVLRRSGPGKGHPAAVDKRGAQPGGSQVLGSGLRLVLLRRLVVRRQVDAVVVGPQARVVAAQRLDPVDVAHPGLVGRRVAVGRGRRLGVGHQRRQRALTLEGPAAQNLVAVHRLGVLFGCGPAQSHPVLHQLHRQARGPQVLRGRHKFRCRRRGRSRRRGRGRSRRRRRGRSRRRRRVRRGGGVDLDVARPLADAGGAHRLHPVDVGARRRHRTVGVAGHGTGVVAGLAAGVALDDVEDAQRVDVGVAAQDGVVSDRLVRRGRPSEGDRIVHPRSLEVGGLGRGISAGGGRGSGHVLGLGRGVGVDRVGAFRPRCRLSRDMQERGQDRCDDERAERCQPHCDEVGLSRRPPPPPRGYRTSTRT